LALAPCARHPVQAPWSLHCLTPRIKVHPASIVMSLLYSQVHMTTESYYILQLYYNTEIPKTPNGWECSMQQHNMFFLIFYTITDFFSSYSQTSVHELNSFLKVVRKPKLFSVPGPQMIPYISFSNSTLCTSSQHKINANR
jgi:hypothetical protein